MQKNHPRFKKPVRSTKFHYLNTYKVKNSLRWEVKSSYLQITLGAHFSSSFFKPLFCHFSAVHSSQPRPLTPDIQNFVEPLTMLSNEIRARVCKTYPNVTENFWILSDAWKLGH